MKGYMVMKIINLGIANFRSFDSEGILIENLSKLNIFIGKNNCGKSNILRFLYLLSKAIKGVDKARNISISKSLRTEFDKHENYFRGIRKNPEIVTTVRAESILVKLSECINPYDLLTIKIDLMENKVTATDKVFEDLNDNQLLSIQSHYSRASRDLLLKVINENMVKKILYFVFNLCGKMIFIPDFRQIIEREGDQESITIN